MGGFLQDLRFAFRQFQRSPGFVITAALSLALGIGATTAMFSIIYGVLFDPYPYKNSDRMVHVELRDKSGRGPQLFLFVNATEYQRLLRTSSIEDVFLERDQQETLTGDQLPVSVRVGLYSPNLFEYMGVPPLLGREFTTADAAHGSAAPVAVLSYLFWKRQFGGSREIINKTIALDHTLYTVIGVAAQRFTWGDSDVYVPATVTAEPHEYWGSFVRLRPGVKHEAVAAELQVLLDHFTESDARDFRRNRKVAIVTLNEEVLGRFAGALVVLFGAVVGLLVIGCTNVSILMLARGTARQHELAVRVSVGAGRTRLIRQLLTEAVLLSLTGAALGVLAAYQGVRVIAEIVPFYAFPHEAAISVNSVVLAFSAALAVMTGILFGIWPAWQLSSPQLAQLIQAGSPKHTGGPRGGRMHRLLIAGQLALTLVLMAGAAAATRAFLNLTHTPLGFDADHVFLMNVSFPKGANATWKQRLQANETVRQAVEQVPGIAAASVSTSWRPGLGGFIAKIEIQSEPTLTEAQAVLALVSHREFEVLHIPLLAGRVFDEAELMRSAHVALINQAFVKQFLGGQNPIGERVRSPILKVEQPNLLVAEAPDDWLEVIGVVGDAKNDGLDNPVKPAVFLPYSFVLVPDEALLVRTSGDPEAMIHTVKERLREVNGEIVTGDDHTLIWWLDTQGWGRGRFVATLFGLFAGLALALAATGLYSVVSYAVTQRTQELGIRMALGAQRGGVVRLVLESTLITLGAGFAVGLGLSIALSRIVSSLAGGSIRDPFTLLTASLLLILVAIIACIEPAWRAASIDPMKALRVE